MHQSTVNSLNTSGSEIVGQSSMPDSSLLNEKLNSLNRRWRRVCTDVANRKDRYILIHLRASVALHYVQWTQRQGNTHRNLGFQKVSQYCSRMSKSIQAFKTNNLQTCSFDKSYKVICFGRFFISILHWLFKKKF